MEIKKKNQSLGSQLAFNFKPKQLKWTLAKMKTIYKLKKY